ncbi:MAG: glycosyltransferase family 9 protein [Thermodesulfobacteriota bacterium]
MPEGWITLVVKPQVHELVDICPYVDEVLTYNWEVNGRHEALRRHWRAVRLAWCQLRQRRFDLAILPRWDADSYHGTFLLYFSGAARRIGYSEQVNVHKRRANQGFDLLLTHPLKEGDLKHEVQHNLDVIRYLGGQVLDDKLELWLSREDEAFAEQFLGEKRVEPDEMLVGLAPGAGAPKRIWPVDRFGELGLWLQQRYGARLLVVGGPGEEPLGKELERKIGSNVVNAVGRTTLRQTGALLKRCRIFVGNDAGPMHVAAAVGIPVVEVSCHPKSGVSVERQFAVEVRSMEGEPQGTSNSISSPSLPRRMRCRPRPLHPERHGRAGQVSHNRATQ